MPKESEIHACPGLDRLVAREVMGWSPEEIDDRYILAGDGTKLSTVPRWSSDPGEALALLIRENLLRSQCTPYLLNLYSERINRGDGNAIIWQCAIFRPRISDSGWHPTPEIAITVGVLLQYVGLEDIERACAEEACRG